MTGTYPTDHELAAGIGQLPREKVPGRDLWPGIASRLAPAGSRRSEASGTFGWRHQALAASVAVAFVAGLIFGKQLGVGELAGVEPAGRDFAMQAALQAGEREYQAAFREFVSIGSSRTVLQAQTVEQIERSWAELQQAEAALLAALHDYPENAYLNQKLMDLREYQLGFMKQLATLDQFSRRKI